MRFLNLKAAIIFLVVVIVLAGGTALLHTYQIGRHSSTFHETAVAAWNDKPRRDADAFQSMKDYLALKPTDFKARQELGGWLAESGRFKACADVLEELARALDKQDPPDKEFLNEVNRTLVVIWMDDLHNQSAAEAHLKALLQPYPLDHPEQIDAEGANLLWRLGVCQRKQGKEDEAIENFKKAIANDANKGRVDIYGDLATTYQYGLVKRLGDARKCMADMIAVKQNAESPYAHHVYGMWLDELGEYKDALQQAEAALKLKPDLAGALYLAGKCALNLRDFPKAEEYAERGLKAAPQEPPMYILMADIYMRDDRPGKPAAGDKLTGTEKAVAILKKGIETVNTNSAKVQLLFNVANLDLDGRGGAVNAESIAAAKECIRLMREYRLSPEQLEFLEARVLYANGDWKSALDKFEKVRPSLADLPPQMRCLEYWIGYCYLQQGNPDQAMVAFRRSLGYGRYYFKARDQVAQIFIARGAYSDAVEEYRQALMGNALDEDAWIAYARAILLCTIDSKNEDPGKWELCAQQLNRIYEHTKSGQIVMFMVEACLATGNPKAAKEAERLLADLQKDSPKSAAIWVAKANIEARHGNLDKALAILDEAKAKLGDDYLLRLARASYVSRQKENPGPDIDALAANLDGYSKDEKIQLLNGLFNTLMDIKDFDRAKEFGRRIAKLQPHDATIRYRLLELDLATHNFRDPAASLADIDRLLDEIKAFAGEGPIWLYGKAVRMRLEAAGGKPELFKDAMVLATSAADQWKTWSRPQVLMGEICHAQGNDDQALEYFLKASVNGDHDLTFNRLLLQMLKERQLYQEAEQVLSRLESNKVDLSTDLVRTNVDIETHYGSLDKALDIANRGIDEKSDDYRDHLWHGQMLRTLAGRARAEGRSEQCAMVVAAAEKSLRKAIEIAPTAADCRIELVLLLAADNQMDKARRAAAEAEEMLQNDKVAPLALAYMFEAIGDTEKARASYEKAVERQPDQPQLVLMLAEFYIRNHESDRAAPLVDKLLGGELAVSEADRMRARRMKATLLIAQGQFPKLKPALALIEENLKSPLSTRQDQSIKARILAADPATARSAETLKLMVELVRTGGAEPQPSDRYALARLYYRLKKWADCREQMEKLVSPEQCDPSYVAAYIKMLLDQEQLVDAALWLDRLEKVGKPGSAVPLRAEWMFRRKSWGQVTSFLTAYLKQPRAVPEDHSQRMLLVAQLYEDFGKRLTAPTERATAQGYFDEAAKLLEENAKDNPAGQLTLAAFYARRGRLAEAIKLFQQHADKADSMQLAVAAVDIMNSEKITDPQLQQLEEILTAASTARKQPVILLAALGALKITQGQPDQAEALYRKIIASDANNIIAHNNLAVLLALKDNKDTNEALNLINRAIELAGARPRLLDSRAVVLIKRGEPQQALEELESILADTSEKVDPVWLFHKAWAHDSSDDKEKARDALAAARKEPYNLDRSKIDPPERDAYDKLIEDLKE